MNLPLRLPWELAQDRWASIINPALTSEIIAGAQLTSVSLATGSNVINHKLGRKLKGWILTRVRSNAPAVYDTQDSNQTPALTLQLHSSAACVVDIWVY